MLSKFIDMSLLTGAYIIGVLWLVFVCKLLWDL